MVIHNLQGSFAGGEVSPHMQSRADLPNYNTWLKSACNFYVHTQGGASNRPGTAFVSQAKYADKECRLIPFVLSEQEAYVLELGHQYLRVYTSSGAITENDEIYELAAPYLHSEAGAVNFVQNDQTLYLAHPNHPPYKLVRTERGRFTLTPMKIEGGPFMLANTDESKKMRVTSLTEEVHTDGEPSTLSFVPLVYPTLMPIAVFSGVVFHVSLTYGFNIPLFVYDFNVSFAAGGYRAENRGGVIYIESNRSTGGDCNGTELLLCYLDGFGGPTMLSQSMFMGGGVNAGTTTVQGAPVLESDFDAFKPAQTGALFAVSHRVDSQRQTGALTQGGTSLTVKSSADWRLRTSGAWTGTLVVEWSADDGATWKEAKHLARGGSDENLNVLGSLDPSAQMRLIRVRAVQVSGTLSYELQCDAFMQEGIVKLEEYLGPRRMRISYQRHLGGTDWSFDWAEGSFSQDAGFPACIFFFQDRLGFAGTRREPQTLWFSKTGEYEDFGHLRILADSDGISVNLASRKLNAINSVAVASRLLLFTAGSEWTLDCDGGLTPYNIRISQQGERGASRVNPLVVGNRALFVQARGGVLRDFFYDYSSASYTGEDLTLLARHLFFNREIRELSYQQEPDNLIWCVLSDGTLLSLTYLNESGMCAWTRHETQGSFCGVCTIPSNGYDETWFIVQRNGKKYIERLLQRMVSRDPADQVFLDSSVSFKSSQSFEELGGLAHLEGVKVGILADGNVLPEQTVADGKILLPAPAYTVHAGLTYASTLQTLPVEVQTGEGTMQDRKRRIPSVTLRLLDSRGGRVGTDEKKLDELVQREGENLNQAVALKTRDYERVLPSVHSLVPSVIFKQTDPLPVTLLALVTRMV